MLKLKENKNFCLLFFLALFGLSIGVFDNYRELWMNANGLSTLTISHVISISYIVTVFVLFYFTVKVSQKKLKIGILIALLLNMIVGTLLICLNHYFWMKFLMFFDIALSQLVLASIYPLMMLIDKSDELYTKKSFVETFFSKLGFLVVALLLGKTIFHQVVDYNSCLFLSVLFSFLSFFVLLSLSITSNQEEYFDLKKTVHYFNKNKVLYHFLFTNLLADIIWSSILGMPLLLLINTLHFSSTVASYLLLGLGILSSILSMLIVKYFRFSNDHINLFIKFGFRIFLYLCVFMTNNVYVLICTLFYLLLFDQPYGFIFKSYFINHIEEKHSLFLTTLCYCTSLIGKAIGTMLCGFVFYKSYRIFILPAFLISIVHYLFATRLIEKKKTF